MPRILTNIWGINIFLVLWLLIGFSQWESPAEDRRDRGKNEVGIFIPQAPSLWRPYGLAFFGPKRSQLLSGASSCNSAYSLGPSSCLFRVLSLSYHFPRILQIVPLLNSSLLKLRWPHPSIPSVSHWGHGWTCPKSPNSSIVCSRTYSLITEKSLCPYLLNLLESTKSRFSFEDTATPVALSYVVATYQTFML